MTKDPRINAAVAALYVSAVATLMYYAPHLIGPNRSVLVPIAVLSLFVLSAAIMVYVFCLEPIKLYAAHKEAEGVQLFLRTVTYFAFITCVFFCLLLIVR